jgi:hypothetical protein
MQAQQYFKDTVLSFILPKSTLTWFDVISAHTDEESIFIKLVEKNNPPKHEGQLVFKCYKDITITDFPIRGRQAQLTFRRRYWKDAETKKLIANDIPLAFPGTKLEREFADFLKGEGGRSPYITFVYRDSLLSQTERVRKTVQGSSK